MQPFKGLLMVLYFLFITEAVLGADSNDSSIDDSAQSRTIHFNEIGTVYLESVSAAYPITVYMEETTFVSFKYSIIFTQNISISESSSPKISATVYISDDAEDKLEILNTSVISLNTEHESFVLALKGKLPGRVDLFFKFGNANDEIVSFKIYIELRDRVIDNLFTGVVVTLVVLANIGMGAKVDLDVVKKELKKPIAPVIGMFSQFLIMPMIAFTLAYNLPLDVGVALGFFALGCSPGGSASNAYTYLLKGNISLSVTMTLISSLAALGFLPLWLFTLGRLIYSEGNLSIPYANIIFSLLGLIAPIGVGLLLQWKLPKVAEFFIKSVKYIIIVFFIFVFSVGIYAYSFIFFLIDWGVIVAAACLPYLGFMFGGLMALLLRQPKANVIAIAIETGIQNTGIPIILLRLNLSGPDKDTGIVTPVVSAIFTPIPIMVAIAYVQIKAWSKKRKEKKDHDHEEVDSDGIDLRVNSSDALKSLS